MILGLTEVYVLISSFEDDKDDGERYIPNFKYEKSADNIYISIDQIFIMK